MKDYNPVVDIKMLKRNILNVIDKCPWLKEYSDLFKDLAKEADEPCKLAIIGEVSAGKSSFINSILGEDLAVIGTVETTATINFFKYGKPIDEEHPVKVVWEDGSEEWQTHEFLDSLQGNTKEIIERAQGIDFMEYYLQKEVLEKITLVDTPGTGSMVGAHSNRTQDYISQEIQLREKHHKQSLSLKKRADAVIVITKQVAENETNKLISSFSQETSSFNAIGVMARIDEVTTEEDWNRRCTNVSKMLQNQLNTIVPVSALMFRTVKKLEKSGRLNQIAKTLKSIPSYLFEELIDYHTFIDKDNDEIFSNYNIPYTLRRELAEDINPTIWLHIARALHKYSIEDAKRYLIEYSGIEDVKKILEKHFINRSRIIKCSKVADGFIRLLEEILNNKLYKLHREVNNKQTYLNIIRNSLANKNVKQDFTNFVNDNICSIDDYSNSVKEIKELKRQTEELKLSLRVADIKKEALILLENKHSSFSPKELEELELLFEKKYSERSMPTDGKYLFTRQLYWRGQKDAIYDPDVKRIVEHAIYVYENLNPQ